MRYTTILFDLDDTLYPSNNGLWSAIGKRINEFMQEHLQLPPEQVADLRHSYYLTYGTTLRGLQIHHAVDAGDYLDYVHDLPVDQMVAPDPELKALLGKLPQDKYIFTNADHKHATRVLKALTVEGLFVDIIDIWSMKMMCKPAPGAYQRALEVAAVAQPERCIYLDDSPRNLAPAREMGLYTVLVGKNGAHPTAHLCLRRPHDLLAMLPDLVNGN